MTHDYTQDFVSARSWLFAPGDSDRKMEKAISGQADAVIFDLEDAVTPDQKPLAREKVAAVLKATQTDRHRLWVRINPIQSEFALDDLAAIMPYAPAGIMLPKPRNREDADLLHHYLTALEAAAGLAVGKTWVVLLATEEPSSMLEISRYSGTPRLIGMSWGAEDLATALGATTNQGEYGHDGYDYTYEMARSLCLVGSAAANVQAIETIHGDYKDTDGLRTRAERVRRQGYGGMLAIHPAQIDIINAAFTPSQNEIDTAHAIIAAFDAQPGAGTIGLNGKMLDRPHLKRAQDVLRNVRDA